MGLFNENYYPLHGYVGQLFVPWKWKSMKAQQARLEAQGGTAPHAATATGQPSARDSSAQQGELPRPA
jgi:hypothetical protein